MINTEKHCERKVNLFNMISILSIQLMIYVSGSLIAPALFTLSKAFPDVSYSTIRMIMTSTYLTIMIFSLISGQLAKKVSKKAIVLVGLVIYGVFSIVGANQTTIVGLIICRLVMGCGVGFILPQANAIIVDLYEGKAREKQLGYGSGVANLGSMIGSIVGGAFAAISWVYNFYGYAFALVIFLIVLIGVPNVPTAVSKVSSDIETTDREKKSLPKAFIPLCLGMFAACVYILITPTNMAKFYFGEHIGSPSMLGITMALLTFAAFVGGFILPFVRAIFKSYTAVLACIITAIGLIILSKTHTLYPTMLAQVLIGLGNGFLLPLIFIRNSQIVTPEQRQLSLSILSSILYFGCFMTSYVQKWVCTIFGNDTQRFMFSTFGIMAGIIAFVVLISIITTKKNNKI